MLFHPRPASGHISSLERVAAFAELGYVTRCEYC